jgi:1-deoxy-D-xylulose 5-phosphate reductoisomerase
VAAFLEGRIAFPNIASTIATAVERWGAADEPDLDGILALDADVRAAVRTELGMGAGSA